MTTWSDSYNVTPVPTFSGLSSTSIAQSRAKQNTRARDTSIELLVRRLLWRRGVRFRVSPRNVLGKPDIVFPRSRVAVFCDGDFWHGKDWSLASERLSQGSNAAYWRSKIAYNIARDRAITEALSRDGWTVLRFWESEIKSDPHFIVDSILECVVQRPDRLEIH